MQTLTNPFILHQLLITLLYVSLVGTKAIFKLQLQEFLNPNSKDANGHRCDPIFSGCDYLFTFCLDSVGGSTSFSSCAYYKETSSEIANKASYTFGSNIGGVDNPIVEEFNSWPGGVYFKVNVRDHDYDAHDNVDKFFYTITQTTPGGFSGTTPWTSVELTGQRTQYQTTLKFKWKVYCETNYYGNQCSIYCVAQDNNSGHYTCNPSNGQKVCKAGWEDTSSNCVTVADDCLVDPCTHGTCVDGNQAYTCDCYTGWAGSNCDIDINECSSDPCQNAGTCTDTVGGYTCQCADGYTTSTCAYHICEVASPCQNNGTCISGGPVSCTCHTGWTGNLCNIDLCDTLECHNNGTCDAGICTCTVGYTGTFCTVAICDIITCHNGGSCESGLCTCAPGFTGDRCQIDANECESEPCQHAGSCFDHVDSYECDCLPMYYGTQCESTHTTTTSTSTSTTTTTSSAATSTSQSSTSSSTKYVTSYTTLGPNAIGHVGSDSDISTGGIVGIVLPSLLIIIAVLAVLWYGRYWVREKFREDASATADGSYDNPLYGASYLSGCLTPSVAIVAETQNQASSLPVKEPPTVFYNGHVGIGLPAGQDTEDPYSYIGPGGLARHPHQASNHPPVLPPRYSYEAPPDGNPHFDNPMYDTPLGMNNSSVQNEDTTPYHSGVDPSSISLADGPPVAAAHYDVPPPTYDAPITQHIGIISSQVPEIPEMNHYDVPSLPEGPKL